MCSIKSGLSDNVAKLMNIHQHSTLNTNDSKRYFKYSGVSIENRKSKVHNNS